MHALSPQIMLWDPSSMGMPAQAPDMQAPVLAPTYPTVLPSQPYRFPDVAPQMFTGAPVQNTIDQQGVVWIQQPQLIAHDPVREDVGLLQGQMAVQQQSVVPVLMTINGQRVLVHQQVTHLPTRQAGFCQLPTEATQLAGINQRLQESIRLTSITQETRPLPIATFQENQLAPMDRPRLTPKRRNGNQISSPDAASSWRRVSDERTLAGLNTAIRRRSQSTDQDANGDEKHNSISVSPPSNKRIAPTVYPSTNTFEMPSEFWRASDSRVLRKLIDIIEYYFSDECLSKNGYMLKQLSNGEGDGYISLRRVAALKRVKSQTRDLHTVACAVRQSTKLEMDEEGTMIRRKRPLPDNMEAPRFIRSVLAINLPKNTPSVEDVTSLFAPYGELTQVRVLRPGKAIPSYLKDYTAWVPDLGTRMCAVVEFENQEEAQKACREINMQNRGQNTLRVALLKPGARIRRTLYRKYKDDIAEANGEKAENTPPNNDVIKTKPEVMTSSSTRMRCLSDSSEGSTSNNNINNNKAVARFHYDASGSGSDTGSDTDSIGSKSGAYLVPTKLNTALEGHKKSHNSADSGYSQSSSSDERDSIIASPPLRRNPNTAKAGLESDKVCNLRRVSPVQKKFINGVPVGIQRQPKGPTPDSNGFTESRQI